MASEGDLESQLESPRNDFSELAILCCNACGLVLRLPIFLLAIATTISNGFAYRARFEFLGLCLPIAAGRIRTRCTWIGRMSLNDSLTLGSGQSHVVAVLLQCFVPFFRAVQKLHLVESPMKVIPHEEVVNAIHNTCIYKRIPIFDTTSTAVEIREDCQTQGSNQVGLCGSEFLHGRTLRNNHIGMHHLGNPHLLESKKRLCCGVIKRVYFVYFC
jgi:hypothetical protein